METYRVNQEVLFAKTIEEIKELAIAQGRVLSKEQVEEAFAAIGMKPEELEPIYEYLAQKKIGIGQPVDPDEYLTEEDRNFLDDYAAQIKELAMLTDGEKEAHFLSAMAGDPVGKTKTIEILLADIMDVAKLYTGQGVLIEDLIGEGNMALTLGVEMLGCLEKADEVPGMLVKMAMDAMEELIKTTEEESKIDRKVADKVNEVLEEAKKLAQALNRKITVEELMEETSFSEKKIREAIRMSGNKIEYFEGADE